MAAVAGQREASIELREVSKVFGNGFAAVRDLSLAIGQGELVTLLGPSGSGKTTTLRMIAGFEQPTSGEIMVLGAPCTAVQPHRRPVNTVFQDYALFPHLSVAGNVGYGLKAKKTPKAQIREKAGAMLERVGLDGFGDRDITSLSGGQRQRVALARALVCEPRVLLLDEPLGALDLKLRHQMQTLLVELCKTIGITFCHVTHDQEEALAMSDRIAVMNDGLLEQFSTPAELYHRPATAFVANFIGENNLIGARHDGGGATVLGRRVPFEAAAAEVPQGDVTLAVRPECLQVGDGTADGLAAVVDQAIFMGSETRLVAHLDDGTRVMARLAPDAFSRHGRGDRITLTWLAHEARAFPR
ncbi:MAG: spermidine/putrescine transporter ATP-binding protein [Conexibacter sp.]|nr:spermidine/putrescine transporter ATP-binding protein [Conexibacter sp.]